MYPCFCGPCSGAGCVSTPTCSSCLKIASVVIDPATAPLSCGGTGLVDIGTLSDTTICTTSINWSIVSYDTDAFEATPTVNSSGVVSFTWTSAASSGTFYEITGQTFCSGTLISQYFKVRISPKNPCYGIVCPDGYVCNMCSAIGACIVAPDVELN